MRKIYGESHMAGSPVGGFEHTVSENNLDDVRQWYQLKFNRNLASFNVAGDISPEQVLASLETLDSRWKAKQVEIPKWETPVVTKTPKIYFVDVPDSKQSVIYLGKTVVDANHPDFNSIRIVNNRLGTGTSARLTQTLRIEKGYTYGAYSSIQRREYDGAFFAATQVRSNVTLESLEIIKGLISNYASTFELKDLMVTKNLIRKGNTRRFETLAQLINTSNVLSRFDLSDDFLEIEQQQLEEMTLEKAKELINSYFNESQMIYVIVGDAKTQLDRVKEFGYGSPVLLNREGIEL